MTNNKPTKQGSDNKTRVLIPVASPIGKEHPIKYLILSEQPKGYICEQGCFHEYPSNFQNSDIIPTTPSIQNDTQTKSKRVDSLTRKESPVAYKYVPPKKAVIPFFENSNPTISSGIPMSADPSLKSPGSTKPVSPISGASLASPPYKQTQRSSENKYSNYQGTTQTSIPQTSSEQVQLIGAPGTLPTSVRSNARSIEIQEKVYDKNSNVFQRLYPFVQIPKKPKEEAEPIPEPILCSGMDWKRYHRLKIIYDFLDDLEKMFPSLCTVGVIGRSVEGRDIKLLKISNGNATNVAVWVDAGIHAREWIGPAVNTFVANHIARNFDKLPLSVTNKDWYFCPVANPDGYEYTHTKDRMWRKNRAKFRGKCVGVDINRNFSVAWGGKGSSKEPNHSFYRGPAPFSEPESCALRNVLLYSRIPFKVYITLHAFGEVIIFPLAHSDNLCPDYIRLLNGATVMSRAIYNTNGTTYRVGVSKDVMYRASGTSNDWCYSAVGIPYCYLIELRSKKHKFLLPEVEINETGEEIRNSIYALMKFVDTYPLEQNSGDHHRQNFNR